MCSFAYFFLSAVFFYRMDFNLHDSPVASCDSNSTNGGNIYLALDFRWQFNFIQRKVSCFTALNNCRWSGRTEIGTFPLKTNDYFEITLRILVNNTMEVYIWVQHCLFSCNFGILFERTILIWNTLHKFL